MTTNIIDKKKDKCNMIVKKMKAQKCIHEAIKGLSECKIEMIKPC